MGTRAPGGEVEGHDYCLFDEEVRKLRLGLFEAFVGSRFGEAWCLVLYPANTESLCGEQFHCIDGYGDDDFEVLTQFSPSSCVAKDVMGRLRVSDRYQLVGDFVARIIQSGALYRAAGALVSLRLVQCFLRQTTRQREHGQ